MAAEGEVVAAVEAPAPAPEPAAPVVVEEPLTVNTALQQVIRRVSARRTRPRFRFASPFSPPGLGARLLHAPFA